MSQDRLKGSHFSKCIILQAVYWYLRYSLSYRDIEELLMLGFKEFYSANVTLREIELVWMILKGQMENMNNCAQNPAEIFYSLAA